MKFGQDYQDEAKTLTLRDVYKANSMNSIGEQEELVQTPADKAKEILSKMASENTISDASSSVSTTTPVSTSTYSIADLKEGKSFAQQAKENKPSGVGTVLKNIQVGLGKSVDALAHPIDTAEVLYDTAKYDSNVTQANDRIRKYNLAMRKMAETGATTYEGKTASQWKNTLKDNALNEERAQYWYDEGAKDTKDLASKTILNEKQQEKIAQVESDTAQLGKTGQFFAGLAQSAGAMAPSILTGSIAGAIGGSVVGSATGLGTMWAEVYGRDLKDLSNQGYDWTDASEKAFLDATVEIATEALVGGTPGVRAGIFDNVLSEPLAKASTALAKKITDKSVANGVKAGVFARGLAGILSANEGQFLSEAVGEGLEELASEFLAPYVDRATINPNAPAATAGELLSAYAGGALMSVFLGLPRLAFSSAISKGDSIENNAKTGKPEVNKDGLNKGARTFSATAGDTATAEVGTDSKTVEYADGTSATYSKADAELVKDNPNVTATKDNKTGKKTTNKKAKQSKQTTLDELATDKETKTTSKKKQTKAEKQGFAAYEGTGDIDVEVLDSLTSNQNVTQSNEPVATQETTATEEVIRPKSEVNRVAIKMSKPDGTVIDGWYYPDKDEYRLKNNTKPKAGYHIGTADGKVIQVNEDGTFSPVEEVEATTTKAKEVTKAKAKVAKAKTKSEKKAALKEQLEVTPKTAEEAVDTITNGYQRTTWTYVNLIHNAMVYGLTPSQAETIGVVRANEELAGTSIGYGALPTQFFPEDIIQWTPALTVEQIDSWIQNTLIPAYEEYARVGLEEQLNGDYAKTIANVANAEITPDAFTEEAVDEYLRKITLDAQRYAKKNIADKKARKDYYAEMYGKYKSETGRAQLRQQMANAYNALYNENQTTVDWLKKNAKKTLDLWLPGTSYNLGKAEAVLNAIWNEDIDGAMSAVNAMGTSAEKATILGKKIDTLFNKIEESKDNRGTYNIQDVKTELDAVITSLEDIYATAEYTEADRADRVQYLSNANIAAMKEAGIPVSTETESGTKSTTGAFDENGNPKLGAFKMEPDEYRYFFRRLGNYLTSLGEVEPSEGQSRYGDATPTVANPEGKKLKGSDTSIQAAIRQARKDTADKIIASLAEESNLNWSRELEGKFDGQQWFNSIARNGGEKALKAAYGDNIMDQRAAYKNNLSAVGENRYNIGAGKTTNINATGYARIVDENGVGRFITFREFVESKLPNHKGAYKESELEALRDQFSMISKTNLDAVKETAKQINSITSKRFGFKTEALSGEEIVNLAKDKGQEFSLTANGAYIDGTVYINTDKIYTKSAMYMVVAHEMTHRAQQMGAAQQLHNTVADMMQSLGLSYEKYYNKIADATKKAHPNQKLDTSVIAAEVDARAIQILFGNEQFLNMLSADSIEGMANFITADIGYGADTNFNYLIRQEKIMLGQLRDALDNKIAQADRTTTIDYTKGPQFSGQYNKNNKGWQTYRANKTLYDWFENPDFVKNRETAVANTEITPEMIANFRANSTNAANLTDAEIEKRYRKVLENLYNENPAYLGDKSVLERYVKDPATARTFSYDIETQIAPEVDAPVIVKFRNHKESEVHFFKDYFGLLHHKPIQKPFYDPQPGNEIRIPATDAEIFANYPEVEAIVDAKTGETIYDSADAIEEFFTSKTDKGGAIDKELTELKPGAKFTKLESSARSTNGSGKNNPKWNSKAKARITLDEILRMESGESNPFAEGELQYARGYDISVDDEYIPTAAELEEAFNAAWDDNDYSNLADADLENITKKNKKKAKEAGTVATNENNSPVETTELDSTEEIPYFKGKDGNPVVCTYQSLADTNDIVPKAGAWGDGYYLSTTSETAPNTPTNVSQFLAIGQKPLAYNELVQNGVKSENLTNAIMDTLSYLTEDLDDTETYDAAFDKVDDYLASLEEGATSGNSPLYRKHIQTIIQSVSKIISDSLYKEAGLNSKGTEGAIAQLITLNYGRDSLVLRDGTIVVYTQDQLRMPDGTPIPDSTPSTSPILFEDIDLGTDPGVTRGAVNEENATQEEYNRQYEKAGETYGTVDGTDTPKSTMKGTKVRGFASNPMLDYGMQSRQMSDAQKELTMSKIMSYVPVTNNKREQQAQAWAHRFDKTLSNGELIFDFDGAYEDFMSRAVVGLNNVGDIAQGGLLIRKIQELAVEADRQGKTLSQEYLVSFENLVSMLAVNGTRLAQMVQEYSMLKNLSGDGKVFYVQQSLKALRDELNATTNRFKRNLVGALDHYEIPENLITALRNAKSSTEVENAVTDITKSIAEQIPATVSSRLSAWRYLAMLGNVRTHERNMISNGAMWLARGVKDAMAGIAEDAIIGNDPTQQRTKTAKRASKEVKDFAAQQWLIHKKEIQQGGKISIEAEAMQLSKKFGDSVFGRIFEKLGDFNTKALEDEDAFFLRSTFKSALAGYITANQKNWTDGDVLTYLASNTPEAQLHLNEAISYATKEAQRATYREANELASWLNRMEKKSALGEVLLGGIIPYKRTPINILLQGVRYSPAGLVNGVKQMMFDVKSGKVTLPEAIDSMCAGMTGTMMCGLGYFLGGAGILKGGGLDSDREEYYDEMLGYQKYSALLGDFTYTVDWVTPNSMPLFMGVELANALSGDENNDEQDIDFTFTDALEVIGSMADPLTNLSILTGVNDALNSYSDDKIGALVGSGITNYASQYFPTIGGQLARTIDPTRKTTYAAKDTDFIGGQAAEKFYNKLKSKLPFIASTNEDYVDMWGRTEEGSDNILVRAAEQMLSPGYVKKINKTEADDLIAEIFAESKDTKVLPTTISNYYTVDGTKYYYSASDRTKAQTLAGQTSLNAINDLYQSPLFDGLTIDQQASVVNEIYAYSSELAKYDNIVANGIEGYEVDKTIQKVLAANTLGISTGDYFIIKKKVNSFDAKDENGNSVRGLMAKRQKSYMAAIGLTSQQMEIFLK